MNLTEKQWARQAHALLYRLQHAETYSGYLEMRSESRKLVASYPDSIAQVDMDEYVCGALPEALPGEGI